jgi:hypothetical protein
MHRRANMEDVAVSEKLTVLKSWANDQAQRMIEINDIWISTSQESVTQPL